MEFPDIPKVGPYDEAIAHELKRINREFMEAEFKPIHHLYVDLECVQDLGVGTLMTMITTDVEFQYIRHQAEIYSRAWDRKIAQYFPALRFTEEAVRSRMHDPQHAEVIAVASPLTNLYLMLLEYIRMCVHNNNRIETGNRQVTLYIGCSSMKYPESGKKRFELRLAEAFPKLRVQFVEGDATALSPEVLRKIQFFLVNDMDRFGNPAHITGKILLNEDVWLPVSIYAPFQIDTVAYPTVDIDKIPELIKDTELVISAACDFHFVGKEINMKYTPQGA